MILFSPFTELETILLSKAKQRFSLHYVDEQTVAIGKPMRFFGFEKQVSMNVHVQEVSGSDIVLAHDNAVLVKSIMEVVKIGFPQYASLLEMLPPNSVIVHLDRVDQLQKVFESVTINGICFRDNGAVFDFSLK